MLNGNWNIPVISDIYKLLTGNDLNTLDQGFDDVLVLNQRMLSFGPVAEVAGEIENLLEGAVMS